MKSLIVAATLVVGVAAAGVGSFFLMAAMVSGNYGPDEAGRSYLFAIGMLVVTIAASELVLKAQPVSADEGAPYAPPPIEEVVSTIAREQPGMRAAMRSMASQAVAVGGRRVRDGGAGRHVVVAAEAQRRHLARKRD